MYSRAPKCPLKRIDWFAKNFDRRNLGMQKFDHRFSNRCDATQNTAAEGDVGRRRVRFDCAQLTQSHDGSGCELLTGGNENAHGDGVSFFSAGKDDRSESGEIGSGDTVRFSDDVFQMRKMPMRSDAIKQRGALAVVICAKGGAQSFRADPLTGAFVGERRAPSASRFYFAIGGARDHIGTGARENEDPAATVEGGVEGDLFIADDEQFPADTLGEAFAHPRDELRHGNAGETDAGAINLAQIGSALRSDFGQQAVEICAGLRLAGADEFERAAGVSRKNFGVISEQAVRGGTTGIDGKIEGHREQ